ncbi:hypothetical protein HDV05_007543 [Chytridiales sp. JEL 0842]|nr:hypothetical protein HDV05_007543 [Chytridiales sp. JEL 0842]
MFRSNSKAPSTSRRTPLNKIPLRRKAEDLTTVAFGRTTRKVSQNISNKGMSINVSTEVQGAKKPLSSNDRVAKIKNPTRVALRKSEIIRESVKMDDEKDVKKTILASKAQRIADMLHLLPKLAEAAEENLDVGGDYGLPHDDSKSVTSPCSLPVDDLTVNEQMAQAHELADMLLADLLADAPQSIQPKPSNVDAFKIFSPAAVVEKSSLPTDESMTISKISSRQEDENDSLGRDTSIENFLVDDGQVAVILAFDGSSHLKPSSDTLDVINSTMVEMKEVDNCLEGTRRRRHRRGQKVLSPLPPSTFVAAKQALTTIESTYESITSSFNLHTPADDGKVVSKSSKVAAFNVSVPEVVVEKSECITDKSMTTAKLPSLQDDVNDVSCRVYSLLLEAPPPTDIKSVTDITSIPPLSAFSRQFLTMDDDSKEAKLSIASSKFAEKFVTYLVDLLPLPPSTSTSQQSSSSLSGVGKYTRQPVIPRSTVEELIRAESANVQSRCWLIFDAAEESLSEIFCDHERVASLDAVKRDFNKPDKAEGSFLDSRRRHCRNSVSSMTNEIADRRPRRGGLGRSSSWLPPRPLSKEELREKLCSMVIGWAGYSEKYGENLDAFLIHEVRQDEKKWKMWDAEMDMKGIGAGHKQNGDDTVETEMGIIDELLLKLLDGLLDDTVAAVATAVEKKGLNMK